MVEIEDCGEHVEVGEMVWDVVEYTDLEPEHVVQYLKDNDLVADKRATTKAKDNRLFLHGIEAYGSEALRFVQKCGFTIIHVDVNAGTGEGMYVFAKRE